MKFSILIIPVLLVGCATTDPVIQVKTQIVEVPIPVACKAEEPKKPEYNFDKLTSSNNIFDKGQALLADRELSKGYETELVAALRSCK